MHVQNQPGTLVSCWPTSDAPRLERELGEKESANAKLSSELTRAQQSLDGLASSHQTLKAQASVGNGYFRLRNTMQDQATLEGPTFVRGIGVSHLPIFSA